uniref:Protein ALP1-like n=1 Tax=Erpetoichthys calabaricus TaxID=27687 RepID=A0A8C4RYU1_ERPCA
MEHILADKKKTAALLLYLKRRRRRMIWVNPQNQRRKQEGDYYILMSQLHLDRDRHRAYFRMSAEQMEDLLCLIGPDITKMSTNYRAPIEPKQRLAVTLRYLGSGESFTSLALSYRLGISTVSACVEDTCKAIIKRMLQCHMSLPSEDEWKAISQNFGQKWNFPNCLGAIDVKRIHIKVPTHIGSQYFHYEKETSVFLLALVDADYRFRMINVSEFKGDEGLYASSLIGKGLENKSLNIPEDYVLPDQSYGDKLPFTIVGTAAFPLKTYLMRVYPGQSLSKEKRIFNYRLLRATDVAENAFGILTSRWRIFYGRIKLHPKKVEQLITAACILHNYVLNPSECEGWLYEGETTGGSLESVHNVGSNRANWNAVCIRKMFCQYFCSPEGSLPWQVKMV